MDFGQGLLVVISSADQACAIQEFISTDQKDHVVTPRNYINFYIWDMCFSLQDLHWSQQEF